MQHLQVSASQSLTSAASEHRRTPPQWPGSRLKKTQVIRQAVSPSWSSSTGDLCFLLNVSHSHLNVLFCFIFSMAHQLRKEFRRSSWSVCACVRVHARLFDFQTVRHIFFCSALNMSGAQCTGTTQGQKCSGLQCLPLTYWHSVAFQRVPVAETRDCEWISVWDEWLNYFSKMNKSILTPQQPHTQKHTHTHAQHCRFPGNVDSATAVFVQQSVTENETLSPFHHSTVTCSDSCCSSLNHVKHITELPCVWNAMYK